MLAGLRSAIDALYRSPTLLLSLTAMFWAGNTVAGQLAVGHILPFQLVLLRWGVVIALLWPIYGPEIRAKWSEIRPRLPGMVLTAALGFTGFNALFYVAAYDTTAVNMGIFQGTMPVFVLIGALIAHGTRFSALQAIGVLVTAFGVLVVATRGEPAAIASIGLNRGDLAMLGACVLYAFYTVAIGDRPKISGPAFFTLMATIAAVTSIPLAVGEAIVRGASLPTVQGWMVAAYVAVFPSCLAQLFFLRGVDLIGPGRAGVYINLVPVFSAALAVALIQEQFSSFHAIALALVIAGIWLAQRKPAAQAA